MAKAQRTDSRRPVAKGRARRKPELPERVEKAIAQHWRVIPQLVSKAACVPWKAFQESPPTEDDYLFWADEHPDAMWAALTGQASGIIVFDFDGDEGLATRSLGFKPFMRTPGGGAHVYCRGPDYPVRGAARVDTEAFPNMDLRADGKLATFSRWNCRAGLATTPRRMYS